MIQDYIKFPDREKVKKYLIDNIKQAINSYPDSHNVLQFSSIDRFATKFAELNGVEIKVAKNIFFDCLNDFFNNGILAKSRSEFFLITEKGCKFITDNQYDIYDPDAYLNNFASFDDVTKFYIKESICSFTKEQYLSSVISIGIASESIVLELAKAMVKEYDDLKLKELLDTDTSIKKIINKIDSLCIGKGVEDYSEYRIFITTMPTIIRYYRNDYSHPKYNSINYEDSKALLLLFKKLAPSLWTFKEKKIKKFKN
jgi:hypothetical protein